MTKYIFSLLILGAISVFAQPKNNEQVNKFIRFSKSESTQLELQKLDSIYVSAINVVDKTKCAFPDQGDTVYACWKAFLHNMATTLEEKKFVWLNETKIFVRCYFDEKGNIDYFFYNTKDTTFARFQEFETALKDFAANYNFGLKCDKKYVQCGNAIFGKKEFSIMGKWQAQPRVHEFVTYDFSDSNKVALIVRNDLLKKKETYTANYLLQRGKEYWEIDIHNFIAALFKGIYYRGIIEVISADKIRLEMVPTHLGDRPTKFSDQALIFLKDKLPPNQALKLTE